MTKIRTRKKADSVEVTLQESENDPTTEQLTLKQEKFCQYYAGSSEFFGNGLQSYAKAYGIDLLKKGAVNTAKANAWRLLTNDYILKRINVLLEELHLNDEHVDKQMAFVITQNADLKAKISAIKEYNSLKKRVNRTEDPRSVIFNILALVQNGNPRIVTNDSSGVPGSQRDTGEAERPVLEAEQSILDQR